MHAIVRKGNGEYYISVILGCYDDTPNDYKHSRYFIVLNEEKDKIVKQPMFNPDKKPYLDQMVLLIDDNQSNWIMREDGYGCVNLFNKKSLLEYANGKDIPSREINQCKELDCQYVYSEYNEIKTQTDIDRFMLVSGGFHDAHILKSQLLDDGTLKVTFDGLWGCTIEMYFSGKLSYCIESRNPEHCDPYWLGSNMFINDDMIVFVDDEDVELNEINDEYCWFKAENVTYRVVPE